MEVTQCAGRVHVHVYNEWCNNTFVPAAQFMYRRDQHQNHSLSSYFDDRDESATTAPPVTTPVSPLATTVTIASPQSSRQQHVQPTAGEGESRGTSSGCMSNKEHVHIHTCMYIHTNTYIVCTCMHVHVHCTCTCIYIIHVYIHLYNYTHTCTYKAVS